MRLTCANIKTKSATNSALRGEIMISETARLIIRDVEFSDGKPFAEMASDGSLTDIGFGAGCGEWMNDFIKEAKKLSKNDNPKADYLAYTVLEKETGLVIGSVGCSFYEDLDKTGITYFIGAEFRGKGYATEAVSAYIRHYFTHYNEDEIIATIRDENLSSKKVAEKAGFVLKDKRMYKDINDSEEKLYCFYSLERESL